MSTLPRILDEWIRITFGYKYENNTDNNVRTIRRGKEIVAGYKKYKGNTNTSSHIMLIQVLLHIRKDGKWPIQRRGRM